MSEADFNKAQHRLERAKKELQWLLKMLSNPATFLQEYELDPSEKERLLNEDIAGILEVLLPYADALAKQTGKQGTAGRSNSAGSIHPQSRRFRFIEVRRPGGMPHIEMAGPGGPIIWPQEPPWPEPDNNPESDSNSE